MEEKYNVTKEEITSFFDLGRFYNKILEFERKVKKDAELFEGLRGAFEKNTAEKILRELPSEDEMDKMYKLLLDFSLKDKLEEIRRAYSYINKVANKKDS